MSLAERVRLRLEVTDRAMAFHSAACHLDNADPEVIGRFSQLTKAIEAVDAYENPPAQECVLEPVDETRAARVAELRARLAACPTPRSTSFCKRCSAIREQLAQLGDWP